jgi:hypothetical protein
MIGHGHACPSIAVAADTAGGVPPRDLLLMGANVQAAGHWWGIDVWASRCRRDSGPDAIISDRGEDPQPGILRLTALLEGWGRLCLPISESVEVAHVAPRRD